MFVIGCHSSNENLRVLERIELGLKPIIEKDSLRKNALMTMLDKQISISPSRTYKKELADKLILKADSVFNLLEKEKRNVCKVSTSDLPHYYLSEGQLNERGSMLYETINFFKNEIIEANRKDGDNANNYLINHYQNSFGKDSTDFISIVGQDVSLVDILTHFQFLQLRIKSAELDALHSLITLGVSNGAILDLLSAEVIIDESAIGINDTLSGRVVLTGNSSMFPNKIHFGELDTQYYQKSKDGLLMILYGNTTATTGIKNNLPEIEIDKKGDFKVAKKTAGEYKIEGAIEVSSTVGRYFFPFQKAFTVK